jgi:hypothetical protein
MMAIAYTMNRMTMMSRRAQFALYLFLSAVDFVATVFLVSNGYADEANPFINKFASLFSSFTVGLAIYKVALIVCLVALLRTIHRQSPQASQRLLIFANAMMASLSGWHLICLRMARVIG